MTSSLPILVWTSDQFDCAISIHNLRLPGFGVALDPILARLVAENGLARIHEFPGGTPRHSLPPVLRRLVLYRSTDLRRHIFLSLGKRGKS
jgi:hypothetical protein